MLDELWQYQHEKGYVSGSDIRSISRDLEVSYTQVEGVISFYHFFQSQPTGKHTIYLNNSILSKIAGFDEVLKTLEEETGAKLGTMDNTGTFGLYDTSCIGMSDQEPAALIDFQPVGKLTPKKAREIINGLKQKKTIQELADPVINTVRDHPEQKSVILGDYERGAIASKFVTMTPDEIVEELKWSGLSGRGGAFFPTGLKWQLCKNSFSKRKFIICNADEGEPGTFKDRYLLAEYIGLLIEGMMMASYTVNAYTGIIYLRAEYQYLLPQIEKELDTFRQLGLLGENILDVPGFNFDIRVQLGAGAYICGEETALIESLEGKRGEPRTKTFFPVEKGYHYKPTIVNNVETFCAAARIVQMGAPSYRELGTEKSKGTKLLSIAGDCEKPGIYEIEWGMKVRDLLHVCGAKNTYFVQLSGPSGQLLSEKEFDYPISREGLMCGGSVMIFDKTRDLWEVMINFTDFFMAESCGLCTPCRAGNYQVGKLLKKLRSNKNQDADVHSLRQWADLIRNTSRCGLGKSSNNFILDVFDRFPEIIPEEIPSEKDGEKEFTLEESLIDYSEFVTKTLSNG
jgi:[NiFe] hydrogenase diaphorase moiety large subunit